MNISDMNFDKDKFNIVMSDRDAGILFEKGNAEELAYHIQKLGSNQSYYNQIAIQCRERAQHYDLSTMVEKYLEVYKNVLN